MAKVTLGYVNAVLLSVGITVTRHDDEYRVNFAHGEEATAYYATDIEDALGTGIAMAKHRSAVK